MPFPEQLHHSPFPPTVHKGFNISTILSTLVIFSCFNGSHSNGYDHVKRKNIYATVFTVFYSRIVSFLTFLKS